MSLKRLLNTDHEEAEPRPHRELLSWKEFSDLLENPVLSTTDWDNYTVGLLDSENVQDIGVHSQEQFEQWAYDDVSSSEIKVETFSNVRNVQICYGMIVRASIKLRGNMAVLDAKLASENTSPVPGHYQLTVVESDGHFVVRFSDETVLGDVNVQLQKAFSELYEQQYQLDLDVFAPIVPIRETIGRATTANNAVVRVNIVVYGPETTVHGVGEELSSHKVYLQKPDYIKDHLIYDNPHVLKLEGFQTPMDERLHETEEGQHNLSDSQKAENLKDTMSKIYSSLTRRHYLNDLEADGRLKTPLLPYQKQALDFLTQRESGPIPENFRLWQPGEIDGIPCYRHAVTNGSSQIPHIETGGGILADEMGMGKTLSILALILRTLGEANDWMSEASKSFDTTQATPNTCRRSKATLVVVPSELMINVWFDQMDRHFHHSVHEDLRTVKYHGGNRKAESENLRNADIVITTYHTLYSDLSKEKSLLHDFEWYRLVLDEAHIIRRPSSKLNQAVSEIKARSRWCLTGTPIQNHLEDIGALFAFIKIVPFNALAEFRRHIVLPFENGGKRRGMAIDRFTKLLDCLCLRRTKELLNLPDVQYRVHTVRFSPEERNQYDKTKITMLRAAKNQVGGLDQKSTFGLFQILLQLRIICNHGTYQQPFAWNRRKSDLIDEREATEARLGQDSGVSCSVCGEVMSLLMTYQHYPEHCNHVLCSECIEESYSSTTKDKLTDCPLCSQRQKRPSAHTQSHYTRDEEYFQAQGRSSKMEALMRDVQVEVHTTKSIIFSCWTHTLNLIERYLANAHITFRRIDGDCPTHARETILKEFNSDPYVRVLIMTTGTSAQGLNLATANRVFLVEPQWNPHVESQAIARALRLGQEHEVRVIRYIVEETIEPVMQKRQDKKLDMAGMAWK